ncbi:MAG: WD40/YVTN/BNR-like repeat-containing protein, partial [Streptosporangiaceae bacterium]
PGDPFDTWLNTQVEQLRPPPGTFEHIQQRAKRRKRRRALMSAASAGAAAAVIVVAVVALPKVLPSVLHNKPKPVANSVANRPKITPSHTVSAPTSTPPESTSTGSSSVPAVPADFAPSSITFFSLYSGFVIGQAAGCGAAYCTTVAETSDTGKTWTPVSPVPSGAPDGSTGVSQIRFIDPENGYAFGPQLYETHDGGASWQPIGTSGMRVTGLETVGGMAYAVFAQCSGSGAAYGEDCTHVSLYSSPVTSNSWSPMATLQGIGFNEGDVSGKIVLTHGEGYFYAPDGLLYAGATNQGTSWQAAGSTPLPCQPSNGAADGEPTGGQLAASAAGDLALACPGTYGSGQEIAYTSTDNGTTWAKQDTFAVAGTPTSLAAGTSGVLTLATSAGIYTSSDSGQQWSRTITGPAGGFSYVGLTSASQGVAVPAEPALSNSIWLTVDGGETWQQYPIKSS